MASDLPRRKSISARLFGWHRWLGWIVALQVIAWVAGGVIFTWVPFKAWVKAEAMVGKPAQPLPADWAATAARHLEHQPVGPLASVASVATAAGPALKLRHARGESWIALDGSTFAPPDAAAIERFARSLYKGRAGAVELTHLAEVPPRALIVREAGRRTNLWRASFDDAIGTRLYFDARSGELVAVRNDAWVLYDFFWRLHLMDYSAGEDFEHPLVKAASLLAAGLVLTGAWLSILALRRRWRRRTLAGAD